jgi:hypothetical protein
VSATALPELGFTCVPNELLERPGCTPAIQAVIRAMIAFDTADQYQCTARREEIARRAGVSVSMVPLALRWLAGQGAIETVKDPTVAARRRILFLWRRKRGKLRLIAPDEGRTHQTLGAQPLRACAEWFGACAQPIGARTIKRNSETEQTTVPSPVSLNTSHATPSEPAGPETGRDGSIPRKEPEPERPPAPEGYTPPSAEDLPRLEAEAKLPGVRGCQARIALAAWKSYQAEAARPRPVTVPAAMPPAAPPTPPRAAPLPPSARPPTGRRSKVPRDESYPLEAALEAARAIAAGRDDPEAQERLVRLLAGRWRDRKPATLAFWRVAVARLPGPDLVDLIAGCDHPEIRLPGNVFSARVGERLGARKKPPAGHQLSVPGRGPQEEARASLDHARTVHGDRPHVQSKRRPTRGKTCRSWAEPGSNRRHQDFQSCALPAELSARGDTRITARVEDFNRPRGLRGGLAGLGGFDYGSRAARAGCGAPCAAGCRPGTPRSADPGRRGPFWSVDRREGSPMRRWCPGRLRLLGLLLLAPAVAWVLALTLIPTGWARDRIVAELQRETGRSIRLEDVRLGPLGGIHLRGLEVAQPGKPGDPWLTADRVSIDVSAAQLLVGRPWPSRVEARGVFLRVRRDAGGAMEIRDLLRRQKPGPDADPDRAQRPEDESEVAFSLADARMVVIDEPTGTRLNFSDLEGHGTWRRHRTTLNELHGQLNGGPFLMEAELERGQGSPMFEGELHARRVALGPGMSVLRYVLPVLTDAAVGVSGRLDLNLYLRGQGDKRGELAGSLVGRGAVRIDPITLEESRLLAELGRVLTLPEGARIGSVVGDFEIAHRRIGTKNLNLEVGALPIVLEGWTDFDGQVDYRVRTRGITHAIANELRAALEDLPIGVDDVLELRLRGTLGELSLSLDGLPVATGPDGRPLSDRARLRETARRLRDRFLR